MSADGTGQPPPAGGSDRLGDPGQDAGHGVGRGAGRGGRSGFADRLGRTGRKVAIGVLVLVGLVLAFVVGQYIFANSWTTHVTRTVNHSTFHGFWYGGWFAFVSVLIAAVLVR